VKYLLDTDIVSYIIKGKSVQAERKLGSIPSSQVAISAVTRAELLYGIRRLPTGHTLRADVQNFLLFMVELPWGAQAGDWYAEVRHQLTLTGQPIGELDTMIAAHALALGATLVTNNMRHYQRIAAPLLLENWSV
jgi:tRNA(fMet)-specific endonuclease VapC